MVMMFHNLAKSSDVYQLISPRCDFTIGGKNHDMEFLPLHFFAN